MFITVFTVLKYANFDFPSQMGDLEFINEL